MTTDRLRRNRDFLKLWSAQTVSLFGSLITRAALPFLAVLVLGATPGQLAGLRIADLLPGFAIGLVAGVWVDRLRRRPVMIVADVGRAIALGMVPVLAALGQLKLGYLYAIAIVASGLTVFFDVAEQAYLPSVVGQARLTDANSRMAATQSLAEISAFGIVGWLVQFFTAPFAIAIDAMTFLVSAVFVGSIRSQEAKSDQHQAAGAMWREMVDGLRLLAGDRSLRAIGLSVAAMEASFGLTGTVYALYVLRELGLAPGPLGLIYAVGGISALIGSLLVPRLNRRLGIGRSMVFGLGLGAIGIALLPLARGLGAASWTLLVAQQLIGDGGVIVFEIDALSLRQSITPAGMLGRVNGGMRVAALGATLLGSVLGGVLGQTLGLPLTLAVGAIAMGIGALVILGSPVWRIAQ